jgi:small conductance mechanosensitive channel
MSQYWKAFVNPLEETVRRLISFVPRFMVAALLFALFYALASVIRHVLRRSLKKVPHLPPTIRILIARSVYIMTLLLGSMVALSAANVNLTAVVTSLGVAGFALGFALKDILENFIAGILLLFARPFEVGDQVTLGNYEGTITDIEIRTTSLRTYADERVAIPNSQIFSNPVVNHTALGKRRYMIAFDTSLTADAQHVKSEAVDAATHNNDVLKDPSPFIRIASVDSGNDVLTWHLFYWAAPTKAVELRTVSAILERIKANLYDAGVPTPTATSATILQRRQPAQNDGIDAQDGRAREEQI